MKRLFVGDSENMTVFLECGAGDAKDVIEFFSGYLGPDKTAEKQRVAIVFDAHGIVKCDQQTGHQAVLVDIRHESDYFSVVRCVSLCINSG